MGSEGWALCQHNANHVKIQPYHSLVAALANAVAALSRNHTCVRRDMRPSKGIVHNFSFRDGNFSDRILKI